MDSSEQKPAPLSVALRRLANTLLNTIRNRVELFALELTEEKQWFIATLCWVFIALFASFTALVVGTITVVAWTPEEKRPLVLLGFSGFYFLAALGAVLALRKKIKTRPQPFSDSVAELKKDIACLRSPE